MAGRAYWGSGGYGRPTAFDRDLRGWRRPIDGLVNGIRPLLAERNIPVAGCKEGKFVGYEREVRVFDVQHIKGLEFEAVFFVGADGLAKRLPDLYHRFVYVGMTRAATYLGVTCEGPLPSGLEPLRPHFGTDDWAVAKRVLGMQGEI